MSFTVHTEYLTSDLLGEGAVHGFSTRYGGVSEGTLSSLNLGIHRGDKVSNVLENYRRLSSAVGFSIHDTVFTHQTHTDIVARVGRKDRGCGLFLPVLPERDGLITNEPGVALTVFSADCTPILLYDPEKRAVGAVHSGWRGTAMGIVYKCVQAMEREFDCKPENLCAAIGPCIGPCCFETGAEVPAAMIRALGESARAAVRDDRNGKFHVDLKLLNRLWLERAGVRQTDVCSDCTACQPQQYWSHRKVGNERGSLAAIIMLTEA